MLLDPETGKMCCLGFVCLACGVPKDHLAGLKMPANLADNHLMKLSPLLEAHGVHKPPVIYAASDNDSARISDEERERRITGQLATLGIKVTFK